MSSMTNKHYLCLHALKSVYNGIDGSIRLKTFMLLSSVQMWWCRPEILNQQTKGIYFFLINCKQVNMSIVNLIPG